MQQKVYLPNILNYYFKKLLEEEKEEQGKVNAAIIADYIIAVTRTESNISDNFRREVIKDLFKLSEFFNHKKTFKEITREDLIVDLNSLKKSEALDPLHKWIGTYNTEFLIHFLNGFTILILKEASVQSLK